MNIKEKTNNVPVWILISAVVLLTGLLVFGSGFTQARAAGGTCKVKILDKCLVDFAQDLKDVQSELEALELGEPEPETFGGFVGPERFNEIESLNGNEYRYFGSQFVQGSTTVFSMFVPFASSTVDIVCAVNVASTSITTWTLATTLDNNDNHSTNTPIFTTEIAADGDAIIQFHSTTSSQSLTTGTSTSNFLILSVKGGVSGAEETAGTSPAPGFVPEGNCSAVINVI